MELAIDTSTAIASLALGRQGEIVAELTWATGQNHTVELLPNLDYLLGLAKATRDMLRGIIVAKGPGSFNGLRVGVATAKGLAFSLGIPLVGIGTLEVEAYPHLGTGLPVCALHPAGRGEIAVALFQCRRGRAFRLWEEHITTAEELASRILRKTLFCGEIPPGLATQLKERLGDKSQIPFSASRLRRAGFLLELGWARLQAGEVDSPATLQPLYLRRPPITIPKSASWGEKTA